MASLSSASKGRALTLVALGTGIEDTSVLEPEVPEGDPAGRKGTAVGQNAERREDVRLRLQCAEALDASAAAV